MNLRKVFDFRERLAYSEDPHDETFWRTIYRNAFPGFVNCMPCPGDTHSQRLGMDRVILLASGQTLYVDEKKVRKDHPAFYLEYLSNDRTNAPGWMEKPLTVNYIAYAFMESRKVYLLEWLTLRRAWLQHKETWKTQYRKHSTANKGYQTVGVLVPIEVVLQAMATATAVSVEG